VQKVFSGRRQHTEKAHGVKLMEITVSKLHDREEEHISETPEERLDVVEQLRIQSGKFLYEYPARLRRIVEVIRKK
jgi:hypothetical protein